jgi:photosystem II stability/assembly factor-like uncharacterized protein
MKIISTCFVLIFLLSSSILSAQDFWQQLNYEGYVNTGLVVDAYGRIFSASTDNGVQMSDDAGLTWQKKNNGIPYEKHVNAIAINSEGIMFCNHNLGTYRSIDKGESWHQVYEMIVPFENDVIKCGYDSVILSGAQDALALLRSVDNGSTWNAVLDLHAENYVEGIMDIFFSNNGDIYSCSSIFYPQIDVAAKVYKSTNYGRTWTQYWDPGMPTSFRSIAMDKKGRLLVGGGGGLYRQDTLSGLWQHIALNTIVEDILVVSDSLIFLACNYNGGGWGGVVASTDGGDTYTAIYNDGLLLNYGVGFSKFFDGRLLMYNYSELYISRDTIMEADSVKPLPNSITPYIKQLNPVIAYPNPCVLECSLKSNLDKATNCKLYNSQSKYIQTVTIPAHGEVLLNFSGLPAGLYFIRYTYSQASFIIKIVHQ